MSLISERGKSVYNWLFPYASYWLNIRRELEGCETVLDLGCGKRSAVEMAPWIRYSLGVDAHEESINACRRKGIHSEYFLGNLFELDAGAGAFDAVIATDVIEHMDRNRGEALLEKMEYWSSKKVIVTTPNGWLPQGAKEQNPLQRHLCAWRADDFTTRGYIVYGLNGLKWFRKSEADIRWRPRLFWRLVSDLSQILARSRPGLAFHLLAVREKS